MANQFDFEYVMRRKKRVWKNPENKKKKNNIQRTKQQPTINIQIHIDINCLQGFQVPIFWLFARRTKN